MAEMREQVSRLRPDDPAARGLSRSAGRGRADHGSRDQDRQGARAARAERGLRQRRAGVDAPAARAEGAGHRLGRTARMPRSSAARRSSRPIISRRSRSSPRWSDRSRCRTGRTGSPSTRSTSRPTSCPRPSATRTSPSTDRRCRARRSSGRATCSRSTRPATRCRTRSARPMSTNISRPRPRPKSRRWSTTSRRPSPTGAGDRLDGARDQGRRR